VEISTYYSYPRVILAPEADETGANSPQPKVEQESPSLEENWQGDRFTLVRLQNLASPEAKEVDVRQALVLLRQVKEQFFTLDRQELRELYQFDRLRDLCCQIQPQAEV